MTGKNISPARRAVLEQRAAAARRRAILTGSLLLATVAVAVASFTTVLSPLWIFLPAFLMACVLGLGRRAVVLNQQNDERYFARLSKVDYAPRQMTETELKFNERKLSGRPVPAVRSGVPTAMAENVSTTVLSRVESSVFAKKHITGRPIASTIAEAARAAAVKSGQSARSAASSSSARSAASVRSAQSPASAVERGAAAAVGTVAQRSNTEQKSSATGQPAGKPHETRWTAPPVPLPTYVSKSSAPRWEAPGITTELQQITKARMEEIAQEARERAAAGLTPPVIESAVSADETFEGSPLTQDEKVSLNSILERRRAV